MEIFHFQRNVSNRSDYWDMLSQLKAYGSFIFLYLQWKEMRSHKNLAFIFSVMFCYYYYLSIRVLYNCHNRHMVIGQVSALESKVEGWGATCWHWNVGGVTSVTYLSLPHGMCGHFHRTDRHHYHLLYYLLVENNRLYVVMTGNQRPCDLSCN